MHTRRLESIKASCWYASMLNLGGSAELIRPNSVAKSGLEGIEGSACNQDSLNGNSQQTGHTWCLLLGTQLCIKLLYLVLQAPEFFPMCSVVLLSFLHRPDAVDAPSRYPSSSSCL